MARSRSPSRSTYSQVRIPRKFFLRFKPLFQGLTALGTYPYAGRESGIYRSMAVSASTRHWQDARDTNETKPISQCGPPARKTAEVDLRRAGRS